jgi:hypothetical protein
MLCGAGVSREVANSRSEVTVPRNLPDILPYEQAEIPPVRDRLIGSRNDDRALAGRASCVARHARAKAQPGPRGKAPRAMGLVSRLSRVAARRTYASVSHPVRGSRLTFALGYNHTRADSGAPTN